MKVPRGDCIFPTLAINAVLLVLSNCVMGINFKRSSVIPINITMLIDNSTIVPILRPDYKQQNKYEIDWEKEFKRCGNKIDKCGNLDNSVNSSDPVNQTNDDDLEEKLNQQGTLLEPEGNNSAVPFPSTPPPLTPAMQAALPDPFMSTPLACRCDDDCEKYGDCCKTVLTTTRKIPLDETVYRCVKLINTLQSVRMISKCPKSYDNPINKVLCENPSCPSKAFKINKASCPNLEVPILSNKTGELYRNIFCARCHSISNRDFYPLNRTLLCSNFSSLSDFEDFQKRAEYQPGKFRFVHSLNHSIYCDLKIPELQPAVIKSLVPNVRFCDSQALENCSVELDLNKEENRITQKLCYSYTQVVRSTTGEMFKNPHCAKCHYPDIDFKRLKCERWIDRQRGPSFIQNPISRHMEPSKGPVGINILFHFSLDMDDNYVGYTSKCEGNEILDFIRNKCVPALCPKGYELVDGHCEIIADGNESSSISPNNGQTRNATSPIMILPRGTNLSIDSEFTNASGPCLLLILQKGEYKLLTNGSLTVNKSGGSEGVILFKPGEYQTYNESTMSVCAEHVDDTFKSSFGPVLSYISTILLALSVICSMIHVLLYMILPQMRNLPGNNLLCLTACLLISQFIFLTMIKSHERSVCVIASITMHYLFLASFCWMNIMSFDIWRTFSSEFLVRRYSGDSVRTFIKYSLFAWLTPMVIVNLAIITDFSLPERMLSDPDFGPLVRKLRPMYGHNNLCWIGQRLSLFVFFAFPVAVIILCNLVLFTLTASTIWLQNREGKRFINGSGGNEKFRMKSSGRNAAAGSGNNKMPMHGCTSGSTKNSDRIRFKLYAKLALIMGLTWILGFLSGLTEWEWLWYPFVIFNGLQGTFIFIAFDCKSKIWNMVRDKSCLKTGKRRSGETGSSDLNRRTLSSTLTSSSTRTAATTTVVSGIGSFKEDGNSGMHNEVRSRNGII